MYLYFCLTVYVTVLISLFAKCISVSFFILTLHSSSTVGAGAAGTGFAAGSAGWLSNRCLSIGWSSSWCSSTPSPYHQSTMTSLCG